MENLIKTQISELRLSCAILSDIGLVRKNNEDMARALPHYRFYTLADGMGGHNAGEVAAYEAVNFLCHSIEETYLSRVEPWETDELFKLMHLHFENTNTWVHHLGRKYKRYQGMGTTLCALLFSNDYLIHAHVGDSRIYSFKKGILSQLTTDHALSKNTLTQAIGTSLKVVPQIELVPIEPGDLYLMCSDGLTDMIDDALITQILERQGPISDKATLLIQAAKAAGGADNVTVVLTHVEEDLS